MVTLTGLSLPENSTETDLPIALKVKVSPTIGIPERTTQEEP